VVVSPGAPKVAVFSAVEGPSELLKKRVIAPFPLQLLQDFPRSSVPRPLQVGHFVTFSIAIN
jgi:hypothetical protein